MTDFLYANAASRPDGTALVYGDERVSHRDLLDRVERAAAGLAERGIGPGDAVALMLPNGPAFVTAFFAITGLGRDRGADQPRVQGRRARLLLPRLRRPRGDRRRWRPWTA